MGNKVLNSLLILIEDVLRGLNGSLGFKLRYYYYKQRLAYIGERVLIDSGVYLIGPEGISIGENTHIDKGVYLNSGAGSVLGDREVRTLSTEEPERPRNKIEIGKKCHIGKNTHIHGFGGVYLGDKVVTSHGVQLFSLTSLPRSKCSPTEAVSIVPYNGRSPSALGNIIIGSNCWLGLGVIVMPGVHLGVDSFARSNSLIQNSFGANSYVSGDPAQKRGRRYQLTKRSQQS